MLRVFKSYSHVDEDFRKELDKHLAVLRREGIISSWDDRRIGPGEDLHDEISANLETADIVLLLISADFLDSDYCYDIEMKRAMERHELGLTRVIPVILRHCDWQNTPFGGLKACPNDGKPVVDHKTHDEGFLQVAQAVRQVAAKKGTYTTLPDPIKPDEPDNKTAVTASPRSDNIRIKRRFSDHDRHAFLTEAFEFILKYFENSLRALQTENAGLRTNFRRVDNVSFEARAYVDGQETSRCGIWLGGFGGMDEILFSFDGVSNRNSCNESMSVSDDGYTLFLKPMGIAHSGQLQNSNLAFQDAAEYFWTMFIDHLKLTMVLCFKPYCPAKGPGYHHSSALSRG